MFKFKVGRKTISLAERFNEKWMAEPNSGCYIWISSINKTFGYGSFWYKGGARPAHRISWIISNGEIPVEQDVLHKCDNPSCVNPAHLFLGTDLDNAKDRINKGRDLCKHLGEDHGMSKITEADVKYIRAYAKANNFLNYRHKLAIQFGLTEGHISDITSRRVWKHIEDLL